MLRLKDLMRGLAGVPVTTTGPYFPDTEELTGLSLSVNLVDGTGVPLDASNPIPTTAPLYLRDPSDSFTRPSDTTAYASGDLVANSTTAASVVALEIENVAIEAGGSARIERIRLTKTSTTTSGAAFRVHFFKVAPVTVTNGDNGAFSVSGTANYVGAFDVTVDRAFTDGAYGTGLPMAGNSVNFECADGSTSVFALIEARGAYTPASAEVFTVAAETYRY